MGNVNGSRVKAGASMLAAVVLAIALSACGSDAKEQSSGDGASTNGGSTVTLELIAFKPDSLTVAAGTTVSWKNADRADHTVTSGSVDQQAGSVTTRTDGRFDSGTLAGGGQFTFTFATPGTYSYFCKLHPATMRGQVTVT